MKYTEEERQEVFNEWLNGVLNKMKSNAVLSGADTFEMDFGKNMNADDEFTASFKITIKRKDLKND